MEVAVCIKAVKSSLMAKNAGQTDEFVINPYDLHALKGVLRHKESHGLEVTCISMASRNAEDALLRCIALGADKAVLLCDSAFSGADTVATTYTLAAAVEKLGKYSLIVCGGQSIDGETGQVPYGIAQRLNIQCIANVRNVLDLSDDEVVLETISDEYITKLRARLPVVTAFQDFLTSYENISLVSLKKAKRRGILIVDAEQLGVDKRKCGIQGSKTKVMEVCEDRKEKRNEGLIYVSGTSSEKAYFIHELLTDSGASI